jgi:predicted RNA-binding Zn-ribbon protein involved in translation (DUF1610 family)
MFGVTPSSPVKLLRRAFDVAVAISTVLFLASFVQLLTGAFAMREVRFGHYSVYIDGGHELRFQKTSPPRFSDWPDLVTWYDGSFDVRDIDFEQDIPIALILLLTPVLPSIWYFTKVVHNKRVSHRRRLRLCVACGYDLRATPEQCPECGAFQGDPFKKTHLSPCCKSAIERIDVGYAVRWKCTKCGEIHKGRQLLPAISPVLTPPMV